MIKTDHIAEYASRNKRFLEDRRSAIEQITAAEVQAARGDDTIDPVIHETPLVLFNYYSNDPEMFYNEVGFSIDEFEHLFTLSAGCFLFKGKGRKR